MTDTLGKAWYNWKALGHRYYRHIGALVLAAAFGVLVAQLNSASIPEQSDTGNAWALPVEKTLPLTSDIDTILAEPLFGGEPVIKKPPVALMPDSSVFEDWRLIGIITEGPERSILITNQSTGKVESAQKGDIMPGGEILIEIFDNAIEVRRDNQNDIMALFGGDTLNKGEGN